MNHCILFNWPQACVASTYGRGDMCHWWSDEEQLAANATRWCTVGGTVEETPAHAMLSDSPLLVECRCHRHTVVPGANPATDPVGAPPPPTTRLGGSCLLLLVLVLDRTSRGPGTRDGMECGGGRPRRGDGRQAGAADIFPWGFFFCTFGHDRERRARAEWTGHFLVLLGFYRSGPSTAGPSNTVEWYEWARK